MTPHGYVEHLQIVDLNCQVVKGPFRSFQYPEVPESKIKRLAGHQYLRICPNELACFHISEESHKLNNFVLKL